MGGHQINYNTVYVGMDVHKETFCSIQMFIVYMAVLFR